MGENNLFFFEISDSQKGKLGFIKGLDNDICLQNLSAQSMIRPTLSRRVKPHFIVHHQAGFRPQCFHAAALNNEKPNAHHLFDEMPV
ncbi:hypothetical protein LINPERPRIM_LOCUS7967, partial [Linum perenne]